MEVEIKHCLSLTLKLHVNLRGDALGLAERGRGVVTGDLTLAAATIRLLVVGVAGLPLVRFLVYDPDRARRVEHRSSVSPVRLVAHQTVHQRRGHRLTVRTIRT